MSKETAAAELAVAYHGQAIKSEALASEYRGQRDRLIAKLHTDHGWTYGKLAKEIGLSRGMVAIICRPTSR